MALARTFSVALTGVEGHVVEVQADLADGLPGVTLVGLPDAAVAESRERIRAAVVNSAQAWPGKKITLALLPANIPKRGSGFDLALAVAILSAAGAVPAEALADTVLLGELGLDGSIRPIRGVLPAVVAAYRAGVSRVLAPAGNAGEAALVPDVEVRGYRQLSDVVSDLRGESAEVVSGAAEESTCAPPSFDLADVVGQAMGRRAMEAAAAGGHHVFLIGSPGAGKTMLAERLPGILPPLDDEAALEATAIYSIAGLLPPRSGLLRRAPYQDPHHSATLPALIGGGNGVPRPGAVSLAHHGVLFLDEAPEFGPGVLDALRQPLERGAVTVSRATATVTYPAQFQLVLAANPCPCAAAAGDAACTCGSATRRRYLSRLSGPLLDRIDLQIWLLPVSRADLIGELKSAEPSAAVAARVAEARAASQARWKAEGWRLNAQVPGSELRGRWRLPMEVTRVAERALERGQLSLRGFDRVLRCAWTLADLAGRVAPRSEDVCEALGMRTRTYLHAQAGRSRGE